MMFARSILGQAIGQIEQLSDERVRDFIAKAAVRIANDQEIPSDMRTAILRLFQVSVRDPASTRKLAVKWLTALADEVK